MPTLRLGDLLTIRQQWAFRHANREVKDGIEKYAAQQRSQEYGIMATGLGLPLPIPDLPARLGDDDDVPLLPLHRPKEGRNDEEDSGEDSDEHEDEDEEKPKEGSGEPKKKVAIIGAGVSGLFLGLLIDYLNASVKGFDLEYDIFEAATSDRAQPREPCRTSRLLRRGRNEPTRFPNNPVMRRVFNLFEYLSMTTSPPSALKLEENPANGQLIKYTMANMDARGRNQNEPFCFNGVSKWGSYTDIASDAPGSDAFGFNQTNDPKGPQIPAEILAKNPGDPLKHDAETNGSSGWHKLMYYDKYRSDYRQRCYSNDDPLLPQFNAETINYLETMNGGTDWYDQAFSETVLESLDYDYYSKHPERQLPIRMEQPLERKPKYSSPVASISEKPNQPLHYSGVFNSTTLGALRRIDTTNANLPNGTKMALRTLAYGQSCKIGIKFSNPWWIYKLPPNQQIKSSGLGHSDLHIRTVVYSSYYQRGVTLEHEPAVLLVSYTWQQDAARRGALISRESPGGDDPTLKPLQIRELARLHASDEMSEDDLHRLISHSYMNHYSYNWNADPNQAGAFAFFRPQQFSTLWPKIITPAGDLVIVDEAASPHHAWVVGNIESAVQGLYSWLFSRLGDVPGAAAATRQIELGDPTREGSIPFVGLPGYLPVLHARWVGMFANLRREAFEESERDAAAAPAAKKA
ncbi:hypothetical protein B0H63DRAFT_451800 [Podospora didyma]|uniref:Amine oxidase domain-containing protein n=1 Tax=Podospora didyma TaxID=330526 RepID=A0AAE0KKW5_9PEZI|nr:hypothetical protein B0H63DRAFT_451800 [Podospora didyma]